MVQEGIKQYINISKNIENEDYRQIDELQNICRNFDDVELKLELAYKHSISKGENTPSKVANEFLYYAGDTLVGYLGISSFVGAEAEINGMVHPEWRRKGIFTRLYGLAKDECRRRSFEKILLLSDDKSISGKAFIQGVGANYSFSEYKMKLAESKNTVKRQSVFLRKARNYDGEELARMDSIFFGNPDIQLVYPEEEERHNRITYIIEFNGKAIGKIKITIKDNSAYIYGFGILPEYRGKGFGKEALAEALEIIKSNCINNVYLDVAAENNRALNLYTSCGFVQQMVMNYYEDK